MREGAATAALALALCLSLALVVDLGGPGREGRLTTTASSALPAGDLAEAMEAQLAAGLPGVALALERSAPPALGSSPRVAGAHARALFELGNAPEALTSVRRAIGACSAGGRCSAVEAAQLGRLEMVFAAVVEAGITDVRDEPTRAAEVVRQLLRPASFVRAPDSTDAGGWPSAPVPSARPGPPDR